jgi:hypothetical protein
MRARALSVRASTPGVAQVPAVMLAPERASMLVLGPEPESLPSPVSVPVLILALSTQSQALTQRPLASAAAVP